MTPDDLRTIMPHIGSKAVVFCYPLNDAMHEFEINTLAREAAFVAQVAHESGQFQYLKELWGPTDQQRKYEGRSDLGNNVAGDGYKFRGRGLIQITGRLNYADCGIALGLPLLDHPDLLEQPVNACRSAAWFWKRHGLNELADAGDFEHITRRINGGLNGEAERLAFYEKAKDALA